MKKGWKITISIVASLMTAVLLALCIYFCWPWNKKFFDNAVAEFDIPGLDTEFVPQGFTKVEGQDKYLISGYMDDGSPSRFYLLDENYKLIKYFTLEISGKSYCGHAGGVASFNSTLWTSSNDNGGVVYRFLWSYVNDVEDGGVVEITDYFKTNNTADFLFIKNETLYVGEFYKEGKYETETNHHLTTPSGEVNKALVFGYKINEKNRYGLMDHLPDVALSVGELVQGIALTSDGKIITSSSYSIHDSTLSCYKNVFDEDTPAKFKVSAGHEIPVYFLDGNSLISSEKIPSMSEEIVVENDKIYVLFESASKKYKLFNRKKLDKVYSLMVDFLAN